MLTIDSVSSTTRLAGITSKAHSLRALSRRFDAYCATAVQECHRKNDRKWITGNRRLIIADSAKRRCRGVAAFGSARLARLRDYPELMFSADSVRQWCEQSQSRKSAIVELAIDGESSKKCCATVLQSVKPPWTQRLVGEFSAARRVWEAGHALLRRSIRCPQPLLFVEFTNELGMRQQYLLTEVVDDMRPLSDLVAANSCENMLKRCLKRLAFDIRRMIASGIDHRALSIENIHFWVNDSACEIYFWGLEAVHIRRRVTHRQMIASLARLNVSVPANSVVRLSHRLRFLRQLLQDRFCGTFSKAAWKNAWREIARESQLSSARVNNSYLAFPYC